MLTVHGGQHFESTLDTYTYTEQHQESSGKRYTAFLFLNLTYSVKTSAIYSEIFLLAFSSHCSKKLPMLSHEL